MEHGQRSSFRSGNAPSHLRGAELIHPKWTSAAIAAAAAAATDHFLAGGLEDSRSSGGNSDKFLLGIQQGQFSRDSYTDEVSLPPPPQESSLSRDRPEESIVGVGLSSYASLPLQRDSSTIQPMSSNSQSWLSPTQPDSYQMVMRLDNIQEEESPLSHGWSPPVPVRPHSDVDERHLDAQHSALHHNPFDDENHLSAQWAAAQFGEMRNQPRWDAPPVSSSRDTGPGFALHRDIGTRVEPGNHGQHRFTEDDPVPDEYARGRWGYDLGDGLVNALAWHHATPAGLGWEQHIGSAAPSQTEDCRCITPGCMRQTWNGRPNELCCRSCGVNAGRFHSDLCENNFREALQALQAPPDLLLPEEEMHSSFEYHQPGIDPGIDAAEESSSRESEAGYNPWTPWQMVFGHGTAAQNIQAQDTRPLDPVATKPLDPVADEAPVRGTTPALRMSLQLAKDEPAASEYRMRVTTSEESNDIGPNADASGEIGGSPHRGSSRQDTRSQPVREGSRDGERPASPSRWRGTNSVERTCAAAMVHVDLQKGGTPRRGNSFRLSAIPETVGGMLIGTTTTSGKNTSRCCFTCAMHWVTVMAFLCSLVFMCGLAGLLWSDREPIVTEGAFGLIAQTAREGPISWNYLLRAQQQAIASLSAGSNATLDDGRIWLRVELMYYSKKGVLDGGALGQIHSIENKLQQLAGWKQMCNEAPSADTRFCMRGDSFASAYMGTTSTATGALRAKGVDDEIFFDAGGTPVTAFSTFYQFLKDFHKVNLIRWMANSNSDSPARSTFSFHLQNTSLNAWKQFVQDELEPALADAAKSGEIENSLFATSASSAEAEQQSKKVRVFYRVDYLKSKEFSRAVDDDNDWRFFGPLSAFLGTMLTTRRVLLSLAAVLLSICAPILATILANAKNEAEEIVYPVIAVSSWFLVSASCADLAIACASGWAPQKNTLKPLPRCVRHCPCPCDCVRRLCRFLGDVPVPLVPSALLLLQAGRENDLPMVQEFSEHAGWGLIVALVFAAIVYPPAIELGDLLHNRSQAIRLLALASDKVNGHVPLECGGPPSWAKGLFESLHHVVIALLSNTVRFISFAAVVAVIIGVAVPQSSPEFSGKVPELFYKGHRIREFPKVLALFGSGEMPGPSEAPLPILLGTNQCNETAYDEANCGWYKCDVNNLVYPQTNECNCFRVMSVPPASVPLCGVAARLTGLDKDKHETWAKTTFWQWVEADLSVAVSNHTRTTDALGMIKMFHWRTGEVTWEPQFTVKIPGVDGRVPLWEEACLRITCYCSSKQCELPPTAGYSSMATNGALPSPTAIRRLAIPPIPSVATTEVFVIWGLKKSTELIQKSATAKFEFDGDFNAADPWAQRGLLGMCEGAPPTLWIVSKQCWPLDFKIWLHSRGEAYPVPANMFYDRFNAFIAYAASRSSNQVVPRHSVLPTVAGRGGYTFFWLATPTAHTTASVSGNYSRIQGCFVSFAVDSPPLDDEKAVSAYSSKWSDYVKARTGMASGATGDPWIASPLFAAHEAADAVKEAGKTACQRSFIFCAAGTLLLTWSLGLTLAVLAAFSVCLGVLILISVGVGKLTFGAMELIGLCAFMSMLFPPLLRIAHQYSVARDGPGEKPLPLDLQEFSIHNARDLGKAHSQLKDPAPQSLGPDLFHWVTRAPVLQTWLVDNSVLNARTCGLGYRLSPRIDHLDSQSADNQSMAPWASTVQGVPYGPAWLKVGERFLPMQLDGIPVLRLQEVSASDEDSDISSDLVSYTWFGRPTLAQLKECLDFFLGPDNKLEVWKGCIRSERSRRMTTVLRRSGQTIIGTAVAGLIAGSGMVSLRMEALNQIGLAVLCASMTLPPVALGLLPVIIMLGLGPTRARRRACFDFIQWLREGQPTEARDRTATEASQGGWSPKTPVPRSPPSTGSDGFSTCNTARTSMSFYNRTPDNRHPGIIAVEEMGFPFTLFVRGVVDHIPRFSARFSDRSFSGKDSAARLQSEEIDRYAPVRSAASLKRDSVGHSTHPLMVHPSLPIRIANAQKQDDNGIRQAGQARVRWESDMPVAVHPQVNGCGER